MRIDVCSRNPTVRQSIRMAVAQGPLAASGRLKFHREWADLLQAARSDTLDVVVVSAWGSVGTPRFTEDFELLAEAVAPWKVIAYLDEVGRAAAAVGALARVGIFRYLMIGVDDQGPQVRRALAAASSHGTLQDYLASVGFHLDPQAQCLLNAVFGAWPPPRDIGELVRRLGTSERTLRRRAAEAGLPRPKRIHQWLMLSQAVALHRIGVGSVAGLAFHLGLSDPSSLSRVCRGLTGRPIGDVLKETDAERIIHDLAARASA